MTANDQSPDLRERGRTKEGQPIFSEKRLYLQFLAFTGAGDLTELTKNLEDADFPSVLYLDLNDPYGIGLVRWNEDPAFFVREGRDFLHRSAFSRLTLKPELTMTGRTYAIGYESDLDEVLFRRPIGRLTDPALEWAIWYPVRRHKAFEGLPESEKHDILMNHGEIGKRFGKAGIAHDIRLACHGLDKLDNDFVIGILGKDLTGPSAIVQSMRKSLQTMHHLDNLGPFFTGKTIFIRGNFKIVF